MGQGNYNVANGFFVPDNGLDHTYTNDNMMIAFDGANTESIIWEQTIPTIESFENYDFSFWSTRGLTGVPQYLEVHFIGNVTGDSIVIIDTSNTISPLDDLIWDKLPSLVWNSQTNTSLTIRIKNLQLSNNGNDFAVDDISFRKQTG
jgi:hypothetical protein